MLAYFVHDGQFMRCALLTLLLTLCGCATVPVVTLSAPARDEAKLAAAAEAFYSSATPAELRAAVKAAQAAGPDSAVANELGWRLAQLEGRDEDAVAHLLAALRDSSNDATLLDLNLLEWQDFTRPTREKVEAHLLELSRHHPSPEVRATAAYFVTGYLHAEGRLEERDEQLAAIPGRLSFSAVGAFIVTYCTELPPAGTRTSPPVLDSVALPAKSESELRTSSSVVFTTCTGRRTSSPATRNAGTTGST